MIQTGIGPVAVSRVKIRDRGAASDDDRVRFFRPISAQMPERMIQTGIGPVAVSRVKIRDRGAASDDDRVRFFSPILPKCPSG